jgi:wobble nucleotide-excising tRNase
MRNDNIKLIEEYNVLIGEKKKLNNLRKMIKESIKELKGEAFKP